MLVTAVVKLRHYRAVRPRGGEDRCDLSRYTSAERAQADVASTVLRWCELLAPQIASQRQVLKGTLNTRTLG